MEPLPVSLDPTATPYHVPLPLLAPICSSFSVADPSSCCVLQDIAGFAKHLKDTIAMFDNMGNLESSFDLD